MADHDHSTGPLSEREEARARLKASVDALTQQASLQVNLQKEPLKMLGGASAVGAVLGLVIGRQFRRSKKIYVDAASPVKHQKALMKAQKSQKGGGVGGALVATLGTLAVKTLTDRVISPKLEELASSMLERAGQPVQATSKPTAKAAAKPAAERPTPLLQTPAPPTKPSVAPTSTVAPVSTGGVSSFVKRHPGQIDPPKSEIEAKAQGSTIREDEKANPNASH